MANFWFALDVGAYNKKTAHLTLLEHGVYFALMRHYYATGEPLPSEASRLQRICRAHSDEELKAISFIIASFFTLKRECFHNERCDEEIRKAKEVSKLRGELGRKGGLAKAKAKAVANGVANDLAKSYTVTDTVTVTNTKSKAKSIRAHFSIPSLGEVTAYCEERNKGVNPQKWFNYYTANGWIVGKVQMKDWRASVRYWETSGFSSQLPLQAVKSAPMKTAAEEALEDRREREEKRARLKQSGSEPNDVAISATAGRA